MRNPSRSDRKDTPERQSGHRTSSFRQFSAEPFSLNPRIRSVVLHIIAHHGAMRF